MGAETGLRSVFQGKRVFPVVLAATLIFAVRTSEGGPQARPATTPEFENVARLVVMIEANLGGVLSRGAGIVFAVQGDTAYVLTADHVVRSSQRTPPVAATQVRVYFRGRPDEAVSARLLPQHRFDQDLAVLQADTSGMDLLSGGGLPFELLAESPGQPARGDPVFPIGNREGAKWVSPIQPDHFDRADAENLYFQSAYVEPGYSGGPVCTADWRPAGIILEAAERPLVRALPIAAALQQLRQWGFAVGMAEAGASPPATVRLPPPSPNPPEGGLREEISPQGVRYRRFAPWGGWSDSDLSWAKLAISRVQALPPLQTWSGNRPDFLVVVSPRSGQPMQAGLQGERCVFPPRRIQDLDEALVRIRHSSTFSTNDTTFPMPISAARLAVQGQGLQLRYTDDVSRQVRDKTDSIEVTAFVRAEPFWPDEKSGADRNPQSAVAVKPDVVYEDSVSFDNADATDHLLINASGGACRGLFWLKGRATLTSSARTRAEGSLVPLVAAGAGTTIELYELACDGRRTMIRVQAEAPGAAAKYGLVAGQKPFEQDMLTRLVSKWIEAAGQKSDVSAATPTPISAADQEDIDRGIEAIRQRTVQNPEALLAALDSAFESGTKEFFPGAQQAYWDLLEFLVSRHLDELSGASARCCMSAVRVRLLMNLLRAEKNLPYDKAALAWQKWTRELPEALKGRVGKVVGQVAR